MQHMKPLLVSVLMLTAGIQAASAGDFVAPSGQSWQAANKNVASRIFSETEKAAIEEYFGAPASHDYENEDADNEHGHGHGHGNGHGRGHGGGLPPGLAKKDQLPPGLQKQLKRNGHLPPGLEKKALPGDLAARLPRAPKGTERVLIGNDVVLLDKKSQLILDIVNLATQ